MKKFTKLFLSCAVVSAVAAASATMAMAADITGDVTGTYNEETKVVALDAAVLADAQADTQATFLVYKGESTATSISDDAIVGIDQNGQTADTKGFTNNGLKSTTVAPESGQDTYTVKVGYYNASGTFTVKVGTFKLGEADTPSGDTITITIGDTSGDNKVNLIDQGQVLRFVAERTDNIGDAGKSYDDPTNSEKKIVVGDTSGDGKVNLIDQGQVLRFVAERTDNIGDAGKTVDVVKPAE